MNDFVPTFNLGESTSDFKSECIQSLERAFEEGHTVDNAAIELKTLRMASNVDLGLVKDVLVSFLVKHIPIVEDAAQQRTEVNKLISRWGRLVSALGADDAVENLMLFQVRVPSRVRELPITDLFHFSSLLRAFNRNIAPPRRDTNGYLD